MNLVWEAFSGGKQIKKRNHSIVNSFKKKGVNKVQGNVM